MHHILEVTAQAVVKYLNAQIEAGAQAVMVFDSWGGVLSEAAYKEFSLRYLEQVVAGLIRERDGQRVPSIVFTKGGGLWLESIAAIGCDAVGLDWTMDIGRARRLVGDKVALQGNLDPNVLFAPSEAVATETRRVLDAFGNHAGARLQPRPRHLAVHPAGERERAGSTPCTRYSREIRAGGLTALAKRRAGGSHPPPPVKRENRAFRA